MPKLFYSFFLVLVLLLISACNNSQSSTEESTPHTLKISVTLPQSNTNQKTTQQFKTVSDIQTILLVVMDNDGNTLQTEPMTKNADGTWSIDLLLNTANAPFTFRADAYNTPVTVETSVDSIPIYSGSVENYDTNDIATNSTIEMPLSDTVTTIVVRTLPSLLSIDATPSTTDNSIELTFNISNKQSGELINYLFSSVDEDGVPCPTNFFDSASGTINFLSNYTQLTQKSFTSTYTPQEGCTNPIHSLKLTVQESGDMVTTNILIDQESVHFAIAFPPEVLRIDTLDTGNGFTLKAIVADADTLNLNYKWEKIVGEVSLIEGINTEELILNNYNPNIGLEVSLEVTNLDTGTKTSLYYVVKEGLSPEILRIDTVTTPDGFILDAIVAEANTLNLMYSWIIIIGEDSLIEGMYTKQLTLNNYNPNIGLEVSLEVMDLDTGKMSSLYYDISEEIDFGDLALDMIYLESSQLYWTNRDDNSPTTWYEAKNYCDNLNLHGLSGRLPTINELEQTIPSNLFQNAYDYLWSINSIEEDKTAISDLDEQDIESAYYIEPDGTIGYGKVLGNVLCVLE